MDADEILRNGFGDARVCSECFEEPDLQQYIASTNGEPGCSFCGCDDAPTCEFLDFMGHVRTCIEVEYDSAAIWVSWESGEGESQESQVWHTCDLLVDALQITFARAGSDTLLSAMVDYLGHEDWCLNDDYGEDPLETLRLRWQQFCDLIKYSTRFFLDRWAPPSSDYSSGIRRSLTPATMLSAIGERIKWLDLYRHVPAGLTVYRARYCDNDQLRYTPSDLGPPPPERAVVANRMSPPGIVMLYAALDPYTALAETATAPGRFSVGEFRVGRFLRLLDLTKLPEVPGFFASTPDSQRWSRHDAQFFSELVDDLTRPIARDDRIHVEYIPTQVVTEYCRMAFHHEHGTPPLDGIVYPSARNSGRPAVVLFADRSAVVGIDSDRSGSPGAPWLELIGVEHFEANASLHFSPIADSCE